MLRSPIESAEPRGAYSMDFSAGCILLLVSAVCLFGCSKSQSANEQFSKLSKSSGPNLNNHSVTEAQALLFATELENSVTEYDMKRLDELVDMKSIAELAFREVDYPEELKKLYIAVASKKSLMSSVISQVKNAASYRFLHLRKSGSTYHPLFRLVHRDGAFAYHEFELMLDSKGQPVASDFYSTVQGSWMQEELTSQSFADLQIRGENVRPTETGRLFLTHRATFERMLQAVRSQELLAEALLEFRKLPPELQAEKRYLIMATNIAGNISEEELEIEAARFKKYIPDEAMLDHIIVGLMIKRGKLAEALEIIQRIDERVGGDKFLDILRANAYLASNRIEDSRKAIERCRFALPDIYVVYRTRAVIACRNHDFAQVTEILREIETQFDNSISLDSVIDDQEFSDYVHSAEYAELLESKQDSR